MGPKYCGDMESILCIVSQLMYSRIIEVLRLFWTALRNILTFSVKYSSGIKSSYASRKTMRLLIDLQQVFITIYTDQPQH